MMGNNRSVFSWSGGKDGAYALYEVEQSEEYEITELLTTISEAYQRSVHHGVRKELIKRQSSELGIPVNLIELPEDCSNDEYESIMSDTLSDYNERGFTTIIYGDIHLEDIREYREENLARTNVAGHWPIWAKDTSSLVEEFLASDFRAITVAVDAEKLDRSFVGRELNRDLLNELPVEVDPFGEHGEYHTFVWDGPNFSQPIEFEIGDKVQREHGDTTIYYCDLRVLS